MNRFNDMGKFWQIKTSAAPGALGKYSHALIPKEPGVPYDTCGMGPRDPVTNKISSYIEGQTLQVFTNLEAVLAEADLRLEDVREVMVWLTDIENNFAGMNQVFAQKFQNHEPTRVTVSPVALPIPEIKVEMLFRAWLTLDELAKRFS